MNDDGNKMSPKEAYSFLSICFAVPTVVVVAFWDIFRIYESVSNIIFWYFVSVVGMFFVALGAKSFFNVWYPKEPKRPRLAGIITLIQVVIAAAALGLILS